MEVLVRRREWILEFAHMSNEKGKPLPAKLEADLADTLLAIAELERDAKALGVTLKL